MHDALDCSVSFPEMAERVAQLGCEVVKLEVPMRVDLKFGHNWADAKHTWAELRAETGHHVEPAGEIPGMQEPIPQEASKFFNGFDEAPDSAPAEDIVIAVLNEHSEQRCEVQSEQLLTNNAAGSPPWEGEPTFSTTPRASEHIHVDDGFDGFTTDRENASRGKILCPFHQEKTPSCQLYADGHYHCFGCGAHGWIDEDLDIDAEVLANAATSENDVRTLERGLKLWDEGESILNTLAARYLTDARKLDLAALPAGVDAVLRFHPRCPFGPNGARHPCLLALFRDIELDTPAGIQRIGLTPEGNKIAMKGPRRTFGHWPSPRAIKLWTGVGELVIGEGVETVLGAIRCGAISPPAWAMGSRTNIAQFPVLPNIKTLTVLVDNDTDAPADAKTCAMRWGAAGRSVRMLTTKLVKDFNDLVMS
jgi:Toprim domain-containing protein/CHC2-type zinc finger protein